MNSFEAHILVIEDSPDMANLLELKLKKQGFQVTLAQDGLEGFATAQQALPQLILLDRMLPGMSGLEICRRLRQLKIDIPILMLTAKTEVSDRIEGLEAGVNDYILKPFDMDELVARIRTNLRNYRPSAPEIAAVDLPDLTFADLQLNQKTHEVKRLEHRIDLSPKEFDLLVYFLRHPRQVLTKPQILDTIWGWEFDGNLNIVEVSMSNLRKKVHLKGLPKLLHTIHGVGYSLREEH